MISLKNNVIYSHKKEWLTKVFKKGMIRSWLNKKNMFQWFQGCDIIHARREYFLRIRYRRKVSALRNFPQAFPRPTVKGDIQLLGIEMQRKRGEKWNVNKNTEMLKICVNIHIEHLLCKWQFPPLLCLYNDFEEKIVEFNWIFKILMYLLADC